MARFASGPRARMANSPPKCENMSVSCLPNPNQRAGQIHRRGGVSDGQQELWRPIGKAGAEAGDKFRQWQHE
jgi:hypothetical protein